MKIFFKIKILINILKYTIKNYSICRIYQVLEFKKLRLKKSTIEFGAKNYDESFTKLISIKKQNAFFSNIFLHKNKNYIKINLQKKNKINKKFDNIIIFNVLEHIYNETLALDELGKILKKNGKIILSTPFIYRYHGAPEDYKRYTLSYLEKLLKGRKYKIIQKKNLGEGPLIGCYSLIFDYLKLIPLIKYPILTFCFLFDLIISIFHKSNSEKLYPVCVFIVAQKKS